MPGKKRVLRFLILSQIGEAGLRGVDGVLLEAEKSAESVGIPEKRRIP